MRRRIILRTVVSASLLLALMLLVETLPDGLVMEGGNYLLAAGALAAALVLPWRAAAAWLGLCATVVYALVVLNAGKISLTQMPLTFLDLRIALANPAGFLGAMKISPSAVLMGVCAVAVVAVVLLGWRMSHLRWVDVRPALAPRAAAVLVAGGLAALSVSLLARRLEAALASHEYADIANMPDGLMLIEQKIGAAPFLALTARYDAGSASPFRELAGMDAAAAPAAPPPAFLAGDRAASQKPDIVIVLLESTFDVPKIFDVTPDMRSDWFPAEGKGQLQGELGVNAIGGGTWISEFEAITGVPSRLFGYAGYYTHVELAPYVKGSLPLWLRERGYRTMGLYPVEGQFYGARAAYAHYGFDEYHDGIELQIDKPWYAEDTDILHKYIGVIEKTDASKPLFAFALTMQNHSPHPCTRYASEAEMPYRFAAGADSRGTCELNEYIARYRSTEAGLAMLEDALRTRQKATGRPYVLAVFGDHQPNSFTGTAKTPFWSPHDYSGLRHGSNDATFYQIRSSAPSPFAVSRLDAAVTMLPTLVSAYVADGPKDMYLTGNFAIQARCGERIALPRLNSAYGKDAMLSEKELKASAAPAALTQTCQSALVAARDDYLRLIDMP